MKKSLLFPNHKYTFRPKNFYDISILFFHVYILRINNCGEDYKLIQKYIYWIYVDIYNKATREKPQIQCKIRFNSAVETLEHNWKMFQ